MNGHAQAALTSFDLAYVFVHVFAIAPSLLLMLGIALLGTRLLPRVFVYNEPTRTAVKSMTKPAFLILRRKSHCSSGKPFRGPCLCLCSITLH